MRDSNVVDLISWCYLNEDFDTDHIREVMINNEETSPVEAIRAHIRNLQSIYSDDQIRIAMDLELDPITKNKIS
jgi:hypothetical protein